MHNYDPFVWRSSNCMSTVCVDVNVEVQSVSIVVPAVACVNLPDRLL